MPMAAWGIVESSVEGGECYRLLGYMYLYVFDEVDYLCREPGMAL